MSRVCRFCLCLMSALAFGAGTMSAQPADERVLNIKGGFQGTVYALPEWSRKLPDFARLAALGTLTLPALDVAQRNYTDGFPGVAGRVEWFAIDFHGVLEVDGTAPCSFRLSSDDGAKLYIDDRLVIDNDGVHPTRSERATVDLDPGPHKINVAYFQGPRTYIALQLFVSGCTQQKEPVS